MAGKKINAFNELCKDIMIANMADTLKAYGGFPELEKQVYDLKACTVMEVASAVKPGTAGKGKTNGSQEAYQKPGRGSSNFFYETWKAGYL